MPTSIFVSYSRKDARLIKPVVEVLRGARDLVFLDVDGIRPGRKWRPQLSEALDTAELVVLFWCRHSIRSNEVQKEFQFALSTGKNVLPILLDRTPLPESLKEFQSVDFRDLARFGHQSTKRRLVLSGLVSVGILLLAMLRACERSKLNPDLAQMAISVHSDPNTTQSIESASRKSYQDSAGLNVPPKKSLEDLFYSEILTKDSAPPSEKTERPEWSKLRQMERIQGPAPHVEILKTPLPEVLKTPNSAVVAQPSVVVPVIAVAVVVTCILLSWILPRRRRTKAQQQMAQTLLTELEQRSSSL